MNDKPEVPNPGGESARGRFSDSTTPPDGTPTVNIGGSYGSSYSTTPMPGSAPETPAETPRDPYGWRPGDQPSSGQGAGQGQPTQYTPPAYNPAQYGSSPQGQQPTQYAPPPAGYPANYPQQSAQMQPYNPQHPQQYPQQYPGNVPGPYGYAYAPPKDPTVGLLLELLGFVGFLGIGHIWAGKTTRGVALLVGFWIYLFLSWLMIIVLIGCLMLPLSLAFPLISGFMLKSEMEREQAAMGIRRY